MAQIKKTEVLVIGAGLAGLTAASELQERGIDVVVVEAGDRVGGRVTSTTSKLESHLDLGGQWIGHGHHRMTTLAEKAKGTVYKTFTRGLPRIIHCGRNIPPYSPSILLAVVYLVFIDLMSRIYVPRSCNTFTVGEAISKWVPTEIARQLLRLLATISSTAELQIYSVYALAQSIPLSGGLSTMLGTHGGAQDSLMAESMGSIVDKLVQEIGPSRIHINTPVTSIHHDDNTGVTARTASSQQYIASRIIVTIPPPMLRNVTFEPPLPVERQALQRNTRMGVVYKAIAVFERPFWRDSVGGEFLVLDDPVSGFFDSSPPNGPGHLCLLVGGTPARELDSLDAESRRTRVLGPLVPFMGREVLQPLEWHEKAWHLDEFCGGGYLAFPISSTSEGLLPMPHKPIGRIHWAGTETAQEHPGYMEGAVQTGERAALEVFEASQHMRRHQGSS